MKPLLCHGQPFQYHACSDGGRPRSLERTVPNDRLGVSYPNRTVRSPVNFTPRAARSFLPFPWRRPVSNFMRRRRARRQPIVSEAVKFQTTDITETIRLSAGWKQGMPPRPTASKGNSRFGTYEKWSVPAAGLGADIPAVGDTDEKSTLAAGAVCVGAVGGRCAASCGFLLVRVSTLPDQAEGFKTPKDAVAAVLKACREDSAPALLKIFGPAGKDIVVSGDPSDDKDRRALFAKLAGEKTKLIPDTTNPNKVILSDRKRSVAVSDSARAQGWTMVL